MTESIPTYEIFEFTMSDGTTRPAIVATEQSTALYMIAILQLIEFAEKTNFKLSAMEEILQLWKLLKIPPGESLEATDTE